jgi:hypothetical protein
MSAATATEVDPLLQRLDRLTQLLELALSPQLDAARAAARENPVDAAILDCGAGDWKPAASLLREVEAKTGKKKSAVHDRISGLTERGFLERQGGGPATEYRTSVVL